MFCSKKGDEVNTGENLNYAEQISIEGDYGKSELDVERRPTIPGMRVLLIVGIVIIVAVPVALSWKALKMRNAANAEEKKPQQIVQQIIPSYIPPVIEEPKVTEEKSIEESGQQAQIEEQLRNLPSSLAQLFQTTMPPQLVKDAEMLARQRMLNSNLNNGGGSETSENYSKSSNSGDRGGGEFSDKLQPIRLSQSSAAQLRNRDLLITQGTQIDCVLETKIITTQPGMTTCYLTRDVYSTSGRVVLLDRGSKVVGFYQSGLQQGQARVFVQWSRVETPSGVVVNLDSPGTGPLGESGLGGWVDRHFWERFSGAIMISIISNLGNSLGEWVTSKITKGGKGEKGEQQSKNGQGEAEAVVMDVLQNSINIVPTLYKNQGERINILIARDLDFSDVYSLVTR
ncbi:type IV secretion system protein VirB10 [Bartonella sp. CB175]|uniref:type IV secretion system protein VirB10 n=1 Tax=Bartonella sp. CB175 TaxID=3112256 RepID=UPI00300E000E